MPRFYLLFALPLAASIAAAQTPCDQLKLSFPDVSVTSITFVPAGPFVAPMPTIPTIPGPAPRGGAPAPVAPGGAPGGRGGRGGPAPAGGRGGGGQAASVPAYCRVMMVLKPSSDSLIEAAMFLPAENWNGKLQVVGNGGWAGTVSYPA